MYQAETEIASNSTSGPYFLMKLKTPDIAEKAKPGQFVMVKVSPSPDPLLGRPLSIHDAWSEKDGGEPAGILLLYQVVGKGTRLLSEMKAGDAISVTGPLGNGFSLCSTKKALLVAGGIGIAPMRFLAARLQADGHKTTLLAGARSKNLLHTKGFQNIEKIVIATDDGSKGEKGPVTGLLEKMLDRNVNGFTVYASGPTAMLKKVAGIAARHKIPCELSLEARMACGIGACHGCVVKVRTGGGATYVRVCKDGPVFDSGKIESF